MGGLTPAVIDVPIAPLNQQPSDTMGPLGRLKTCLDVQIKKYEPHYVGQAGVVPAKVKVDPRDAFVSLPISSRNVTDGTAASPVWTPPELLNSLDDQLVSICNSTPRVFNGNTWSYYGSTATLTNKLFDDVFHTSQHTIQAPDSAWISGVTCAVWTETVVGGSGPITTTYVGFRSDNGAWIVTPTVLFASTSSSAITLAKVVSDGTHFFVFYNDATLVHINVYDTNGALLGASSGPTNIGLHASPPGTWDVTAAVTGSPNAGTVIFAQAFSTVSDNGIFLTSVGWSGSAVTAHSNLDTTIRGVGPVAWLTNDTGNGFAYLATLDSVSQIYAYKISALAQVHQFGPIYTIGSDDNTLDSITGYATQVSGLSVVLSVGLLPNASTPASAGPPVDPGFRYIVSVACDSSNDVATLRTTQSVCQVSRAFVVDGEYYVYAYYQSGAGIGITPVSQNVTITAGDYMTGAAVQPVNVQTGDLTKGSPITVNSLIPAGVSVYVSNAHAAVNIAAGDFVNTTTVTGYGAFGIPDGTTVLVWSLSGRHGITGDAGGRLVVTGSSSSAANHTWDIIGIDPSGRYLTPLVNTSGITGFPIAVFTLSGTFSLTSMTEYNVSDLSPFINTSTETFFANGSGTVVVSGSTHGNNISSTPVARVYYRQAGPNYIAPGSAGGIWVVTAGQTSAVDTFSAVLSPNQPNAWIFGRGEFDAIDVGANLVVSSNPSLTSNVGTFPITSVPDEVTVVTGGATSLIAQCFGLPLPTIAVQLTTQVAYTFKLQSLTLDYRYQNAIVSVQGADAVNNGTYQIIQINTDGTFVATPTNGLSNQVNESLTGAQTITIFLSQNTVPEFQPTWFLVPITGSQPVVGRFEYGLAYADWRAEGDSTFPGNLYPMAMASVPLTGAGRQVALPYRAQNITSSVREVTAAGQVDIGQSQFDSTVGLKTFLLANSHGQSYSNSGELLIPGPMATVFTPSGFREDNINLALEAPFLVSQSAGASGKLALTLGATYFYVAVAEQTDENGNRIFSPPSPALQVSMSGANNVATLGGRLMFPLGSTGQVVANTFGPTVRQVTISLYRTAFINGVPTTQRYKITDDLNPNGLAPISTLNPSGFSFPDSFTWNYIDQNDDGNLTANEILYTDKGYLARYPAPAFSGGVGSWKNREWVIGYDGAIWMSGEKTEGDAVWFNPVFRYVLPTDDEPRALAAMEDYLLVFCAHSVWYIPATTFPDATGSNGTLPTPVQLPFPNGSANGFAVTLRDGVAYDSTAGGVWMVTRSLDNVWLGEPVEDTLTGVITGLAVDEDQRLFVTQTGSQTICVYDRVPQAWYQWRAPTQGVLLSTYQGEVIYQDTSTVNLVTPGATADVINGVTTGIAPDITLAPFNFANVRGVKRVWEFQAVGTYLGPHRLNVVLSYPEDDGPSTTYNPFIPSASKPYVIPFNPKQEEAEQFGVRMFVDFNGISVPGASASFELISAQVGVDPGIGVKKRPTAVTMRAKT